MSSSHAIRPTLAPALTTAAVFDALGISTDASPIASVADDRVSLVAEQLLRERKAQGFQRAAWDDALFWNVDADPVERSQFFAIGNAINFRFWRLDGGEMEPAVGTIEGQSFRGAMYMWRCLRRTLEREDTPLLSAEFLAELSDEEFDATFSDDTGANPLEVAREDRINNLRDLGRKLSDSWGGQFYNVAQASERSIVAFARLSAAFRAFDDPIFKLTMVNAIVHSGSGVYEFRDEPLPAIDYHLLRQALRQGMVVPSEAVASKLLGGELLDRGEASELRRIALMAFVSLSVRTGLSGEVIDNIYWMNRADTMFLAGAVQSEFGLPLELTRYY
jgi:putative queuosine salvage protein